MKLSSLTIPVLLLEMAAKKVCPVCGHGMVNYHFYYKGGFRCKATSLAAPNIAAAKQSAASLVAAGYPPTLDGLKAQTNGVAPGSSPTSAPSPTKTKAPSVAKSAPAASQPAQVYSGDQAKISSWLTEHDITEFTINSDNTVDVKGDVDFHGLRYKKLPVKFKSITGDLTINGGLLITLEGLPSKISGSFHLVSVNTLETLRGFPTEIEDQLIVAKCKLPNNSLKEANLQYVGGSIHLNTTTLVDFEGCPRNLTGSFLVTGESPRTLKGMPDIVEGDVSFVDLRSISNLTGISSKIKGSLDLGQTNLKALTGLGDVSGQLRLTLNKGTLDGCPKQVGSLRVDGVAGQFIDGLTGVTIAGDCYIGLAQKVPLEPGVFKGIHKKIASIDGEFTCYITTTGELNHKTGVYEEILAPGISNLLGIVKINGIKRVKFTSRPTSSFKQIETLFNQCITGTIDIHELQEQLIDSGYSNLAKL